MSRRNFILLIIVLAVLTGVILGVFYFYRPLDTGTGAGETNFLSRFNPFSRKPATPGETQTPGENTEPETLPEAEVEEINLKKISSMPVAGYGLFQKEVLVKDENGETVLKSGKPVTELFEAIRYVARTNGNIYQTFLDEIGEKRFSNTFIPRIYEAYFGNKGQSVVMRYLKTDDRTIDTFVGSLPKEVPGEEMDTNEVRGNFLPENIKDVSISPDGLKMFYLLEVGESMVGTTYNFADGKRTQIFDSPFTEWLSWWPNAKTITLTTKPSGMAEGHMYSFDIATKRLSGVVGKINGLTTLASPDDKMALYSGSDLGLNLYTVSTKSSRLLGLNTLPEKCTWNKTSIIVYCAAPRVVSGALYPDAWYKGQVSFSDQIWKIDTASGATTLLSDPIQLASGEEIDGIKLGLSADEKYLFLVNKKDSYLWQLKIN